MTQPRKQDVSKPDDRDPPVAQGEDTSEAVSGGPEDLMVQDLGGTLPLDKGEVPHYYEKSPERGKGTA